jgi:hypothetical protein
VLVHNARHQSGRIDLEEGRLVGFALEGVDQIKFVRNFQSLPRVQQELNPDAKEKTINAAQSM